MMTSRTCLVVSFLWLVVSLIGVALGREMLTGFAIILSSIYDIRRDFALQRERGE
jgi:hypothetical protein